MGDLDLAAAILLWVLILTCAAAGLIAIFRTATASIRHLLAFKPFNCDTCMSFWGALAVTATWLAFTGFVSVVDSIMTPAVAIVGSVGLNYLLRQHRKTAPESATATIEPATPGSTGDPPDTPPVST